MKKTDKDFLQLAIALSKKCTPVSTAFCVGAVIIDRHGNEIANAYSRETEENKHAEEIAIEKALQKKADLKGAILYSSLEPCGQRLSGKKTCVEQIIESGIKCVIFAEYEPSTFVEGLGEELLKQANIKVSYLSV